MAKEKAPHPRQKGQASIKSFFKKDGAQDGDSDDDSEEAAQTYNPKASPDASPLPPINDIYSMFADIVSRTPQLLDVVDRLGGRPLRVATMCSGTEAPLLALGLVSRALHGQKGKNLDITHVFSSEIVPFKQAYIERNFQPPLLFRDVTELGSAFATTAYGSRARVPGNVDVLIAGTSCVDYSSLNNEKQDIDAGGESGRTFHGMISWVRNHRPTIVILENVCSAPWDRVVQKFEAEGYSASHRRLDTKLYYIPHTRTRGYLIAFDVKGKPSLAKEAMQLAVDLQRPASSTLEAFLLPSDDPRIHQAREKLVQLSAEGRTASRTDWGRCETRHQRARLEEKLGVKRPLTEWSEGGTCKFLDFCWGDWGGSQVERVWDLLDITHMRAAKRGIDPGYKALIWNLSQNVDRTIGSNRPGVAPCLTPTMIPYLTNRGGPLVGIEALSLQGIPVDELLLTRENEDQLADLAGNAMSTTVVGTTILASLITGMKLLKKKWDIEDGMDVDQEEEEEGAYTIKQRLETSLNDHIIGEDHLSVTALDLSATSNHSLTKLLECAQRSIRLCACEGALGMATRELRRCQDCQSTSCIKCGGRPEHNFQTIDFTSSPRLAPSEFRQLLKSTIPMCLFISGVDAAHLDSLRQKVDGNMDDKVWQMWREYALDAFTHELRFKGDTRREIWTATYESPSAYLEFHLHPLRPEWRLYGRPKASVPANSPARKYLTFPIARMVCDGGILDGTWEFGLPATHTVDLTFEGVGELTPAWEQKLGLLGDEFREKEVWSQYKVTVPSEAKSYFDRDISGLYTLVDKCGTANSALHKKEEVGEREVPLYLLLDPTRCGEAPEDGFVFSDLIRRVEHTESRPAVARLDLRWRPSDLGGPQEVSCTIPYQWIGSSPLQAKASHTLNATLAAPAAPMQAVVTKDSCESARAILVCTLPIGKDVDLHWGRSDWFEVVPLQERAVFQSLAWLIERIRIVDHLSEWTQVDVPRTHQDCERCAPKPPALQWYKAAKGVIALEDTAQAAVYEQALKHRPSPFVTQLKVDGEGMGTVRFGINFASLIHRALADLPSQGRTAEPRLSWRLTSDYTLPAVIQHPKYVLKSNRHDPQHSQPPNFIIDLRPEQLRSLHWMLQQESPDARPFVEEEVAEAILQPLGWRAEGKAERPFYVSGGVLADEVGYGKTAITLGLIDCTRSEDVFKPKITSEGRIKIKANLIVVPPHLTRQWQSETQKFTGKKYKTIILSTVSNLNALSIEDFIDADLIFVASNFFKSEVYLGNLQSFAAHGPLPSKDGRHFNARLQDVLAGVGEQVKRLESEGASAVYEAIVAGATVKEDPLLIPTKRLKGKLYRAAVEAAAASQRYYEPKRNGRFEVVITRKVKDLPPRTPGWKPEPSSGDEDMCDAPVTKALGNLRLRRKSSSSVIMISDDDDGVQDQTSEYEDNESNDDDDSVSDVATSETSVNTVDSESELETVPKKVHKAKVPPKPKAKPSKPATAKPGKKRSAENSDEGPAVKKQKVTKPRKSPHEGDPWKLKTPSVRNNWKKMQAPPLEIFDFSRVVIDEYTYLDGKSYSVITKLRGSHRWVLSGTPPTHDFGSVKTIAAFLDIHLGVDDEGEGRSEMVKKRKREQTAVEKFHSFREVRSLDWHANRHALGQRFLDQFVRQNIAEIDEIPSEMHIETVTLPAAERAIYLELEHHLRALDMVIKRGKKTESDREKRLQESLGESKTAEEALLKRCSHFEIETHKENAMKACEVIVQDRTKQLEDCKAELREKVAKAATTQLKVGFTEEATLFQRWLKITKTEGVGDKDATDDLLAIQSQFAKDIPFDIPTNEDRPKKATTVTKKPKKSKGGDEDDVPKTQADLAWNLREQTHVLRKLEKELVGRHRSLRYFTIVRDIQKHKDAPPLITCPMCSRKNLPLTEISILSSCGHMGCASCIVASAEKELCIFAGSGPAGCSAPARLLNIVKAETLGIDDENRDANQKHFGKKLERVIDLVKKEIPKNERVLLFVQFPDLMKKVSEALSANKVPFLEIKGTATQKSRNLEKFQDATGNERVLLLNVMDESASGANLTGANHVIFLSPLLAPQEVYDAVEIQAIGRIRRYGQTKRVHIWRFLTKDSIDETIYQERTGGRSAH